MSETVRIVTEHGGIRPGDKLGAGTVLRMWRAPDGSTLGLVGRPGSGYRAVDMDRLSRENVA